MHFVTNTCLLVLSLLISQSLSKQREIEGTFRAKKLNMIWKKLQNKMSDNKLRDLKLSLTELDDREMKWKELKFHGGDADGEIEADLRRTLFRILERYGQEKLVEAPKPKFEHGVEDNKVRTDGDFGDGRLMNLWRLAKEHGKFDKIEMAALKTEFEHHKEKVNEYNILLNTLQEQHEISDNSVKSHDRLKEHEMDQLKTELKNKYVDMKKNFDRLREKVTGEVVQTPFKDYRVIELWEKAKVNNFTEQELQSIKEELQHFEHKIGKQEHFKNAAMKSEKMLNAGHNIDHDVYKEYAKKAKEHSRYVKKMHHTLLEKISRREEL